MVQSNQNPYCEIDLPPPIQHFCQRKQRVKRRQLGQYLARRRAVSQPRINDRFKDESTVVYRRGEDWTGNQAYKNCTFLDQHDTVLASDTHGRIDIIRLPRLDASEKPRVLGSNLASKLEIHPPHSCLSSLKLKSLQGGKAFAVGFPSGNYHVVASELASCWGATKFNLPTLSHTKQPTPKSYMHDAWNIKGPCRRFSRYALDQRLSLAHMTQSMIKGQHRFMLHHRHELTEIENWNTVSSATRTHMPTTQLQSFPHLNHDNQQARWDFRETSSSLLAAHVDAELDCFWLRLMDDRYQKMALCVDISTTKAQAKHLLREENITACAFASEYCLATSHVVTQGQEQDEKISNDSDTSSLSCVKLWDIRMLRQEKPMGIHQVSIPSFPNDSCIGMEPTASMFANQSQKDGLYITTEPDRRSQFEITDILSPTGNEGTLVVATKCADIEYYVLDLGRQCFTRRIRQTSSKENCKPVNGIAASHNFMACLQGGTSACIYVYNLYDTPVKSLCGKRKVSSTAPDKVEVADNTWSYRFDPILKDRYGLNTELSCLAMNDSGTSILGGSDDGDLFIWRGT